MAGAPSRGLVPFNDKDVYGFQPEKFIRPFVDRIEGRRQSSNVFDTRPHYVFAPDEGGFARVDTNEGKTQSWNDATAALRRRKKMERETSPDYRSQKIQAVIDAVKAGSDDPNFHQQNVKALSKSYKEKTKNFPKSKFPVGLSRPISNVTQLYIERSGQFLKPQTIQEALDEMARPKGR